MIPALLVPLFTIFPRVESFNLADTLIRAPKVLDIDQRYRATAAQNGAISFDHETCRDLILNYINTTAPNKTDYSPALDRLIFAPNLGYPQNGNSSFYSGKENMTITVPACQQLCELPGITIDWYADKGPRLMTWIIPVALLLSNIELSPLDKRRFYTLLQAIGNPIDVLWSLTHKLNVRTKLHAQVQNHPSFYFRPSLTRTVTAVLAAFEELLSPELAAADSSKFIDILTYLFPDSEQVMQLWKATALELADSRTDEQLRSLFAVILYIIQILSAFVFEIGGGSPNPPGGVIAAALTLTFLIPMVFLSAAIGAFTSRRSCLRIMKKFVKDVRCVKEQDGRDLSQNHEAVRRLFARVLIVDEPPRAAAVAGSTVHGPGNDDEPPESWKSYFKNLHWRGGKDTYRPWKMRGRAHIGGSPSESSAYLSATSLDPTSTHTTTTVSGPPPSTHFLVLDCDDTEHNTQQPRKANNRPRRIIKTTLHRLKSILAILSWPRSIKPFLTDHRTPIFHLLLATLPVLIGVLSGGGLLFLAAEAGWSCRHILFVVLLTAWLASLSLSALFYACIIWGIFPKSWQKWHWYFCFWKDLILGATILVFVCLTAAGFFNSCSCWAREMFAHLDAEGNRTPYVVLNVDELYIRHNHREFPGIVSGAVAAQIVWTAWVVWRNWEGYLVLRWGEKTRQAVWRELYGPGIGDEDEIDVRSWFRRLGAWGEGLWLSLRNPG
ncbi:hypothetical protein QBC37DRAFT_486420 [Rhypophila decipiens]|uniref:Uncharacterized protein n=1 Tax=Rhypophila decipiens TaxID=261697 RepID=A0AAN6XYF6_9PEZI|nr:hypothetical protein QBC37DRAFT_486420 [Rhypophila decipiens]